ncbi:glycosyltransferase family 4 protein, partial [Thermodesulfobacteriota bacterium]
KYYQDINSVAIIGNYLPRQCGIATFTNDLVEGLSIEAPDINFWTVAMNDRLEGYAYPEKVRFEISQNLLADYDVASEFLNINKVDIVCVQHEYGIFGGPAGSNLLKLLGGLRMPTVITMHTVLKEPSQEYREVTLKLASLSEKLIVMSRKASTFLRDIYNVPENKIAFIHHGIPDMHFIDPNFYKDQFGVEGKKVLLTFGLLSPNKGIENVLDALPAVVRKHPDLAYVILGATHPQVLQSQGEAYRIGLQQQVLKLNLQDHVIFQNRFVELNELCEFLGMTDVYITPYTQEAQITSGTLVYAMGTGKAVISTPYWYATEMLSDGRGRIVPFNDIDAMANEIIDLFDNDTKRHAIRKKAYTFCREAIWKEVSRKYLDVFSEVAFDRAQKPRPRHLYIENMKVITKFELPDIKFDHLKTLTDDTGILQHATHTIPNRDHGYCTDDNARALMAAAIGRQYVLKNDISLEPLISKYLSFLMYAFNVEKRRFRNYLSYSRIWTEEKGSEDAHGRVLWGLGKSMIYFSDPGQIEMSTMLLKRALDSADQIGSHRAIAFILIGIDAYLNIFTGDTEVKRVYKTLANKLFNRFQKNETKGWPWLENALSYANGKLPHALITSGRRMEKRDMIDAGLRSLKWLFRIQTEDGHFVPVGNNGWCEKGGTKARFDQQPIEAHSMIEACVEAFNTTHDKIWIDNAVMCFNWFLGHNDLNVPLYDAKTGGCCDGLMADGINENEGAESTLAWLLSHMAMQNLHENVILRQSTKKDSKEEGNFG